MIKSIQLIRNIGQFDSVNSGASILLARLTLAYAENGRGKTTLTAILRSLATGDPISIAERRRLAAQHPPHVVLDCSGGPPAAIFQYNAWNRTLPSMIIFDDFFVDQNIYSGLVVESGHRQSLHDLILGPRGVALTGELLLLIAKIEEHNASLRAKAAVIPVTERGGLSIDDFCLLPARSDIDEAVQLAERALAAVKDQNAIRNTPEFEGLNLPVFDVASIDQILQQDLPALDAEAATRVQAHLAALGEGAETWVADGMGRILQGGSVHGEKICPFCAQDLTTSPVIVHYRAYFSDSYAHLKGAVAKVLELIDSTHGGDVPIVFEREVRVMGERRQFWSRFCDVPGFTLDTTVIARDWKAARDAVVAALSAKQAAPLDRQTLSNEARIAIAAYETHRQALMTLSQQLQQTNQVIRIVKEGAALGNLTALTSDIVRLKAVKARHIPTLAALCNDYLVEKTAKVNTEQLRDQAKTALEQYRASTFPGYQTAINRYLSLFNAGYRLDSVSAADTRGGPTCTYNIVINNTLVPVTGTESRPGEPSFRNTLSAGDRNTLALAFFFASLDQDPDLSNKVVVIDDPMSSLDEHRSLTTAQELRRLSQRAAQVIVLSHNKSFLCRIWEGADRTLRAAFEVSRDQVGSTISSWNVDSDSITEHDRRHALLRTYLANGISNKREVACAVRPMLESFFRVANPEYFLPGTLLGPFKGLCEQRRGTAQQILNDQDIQELGDLIEYANKFHHDTNPAWDTEVINDGQLQGFVDRTLKFTRRI